MKQLFFLAAVLFSVQSEAQVLKRLGDRAKQKMEQKAGQKVDKTIDESLDGTKKTTPQEASVKESASAETTESSQESATKAKDHTLKAYSKFDFVPGAEIMYAEDFSQDVVGEFPAKWNTNGSGEIVTLEGVPGKWLKLQASTEYNSAFKRSLPENYTVEFDLILDYKDDQYVPIISTNLLSDVKPGHSYGGKIELTLAPNSGTSATPDAAQYVAFNADGREHQRGTNQYYSTFNAFNHKKTPVHVAIWVQKERFRAWINQDKIYDMPKGVAPDVATNHLLFETGSYGGAKENFQYFISNIKIAAAAPDTRNKLITEGKWSTSGILFNVNSDQIKPTSFGVLKDIAGVLKENPNVNVKIIGHTDNDGDDAANLDLSKRRAAAVKAALASEFGIDTSRMETDGMGETKPVADNSKAEGKAQNRRVEFVKM